MSDTPRTDAAAAAAGSGQPGYYSRVPTEFARTLERELAEARYRPMGDNHHNALACPYCNPKREELAPAGTAAYAGMLAELLAEAKLDCHAHITGCDSVGLIARIDAALAKNPKAIDKLVSKDGEPLQTLPCRLADSHDGQPCVECGKTAVPEIGTKITLAGAVDYLRAVARDYRKDITPEFPVATTPEWLIADFIEEERRIRERLQADYEALTKQSSCLLHSERERFEVWCLRAGEDPHLKRDPKAPERYDNPFVDSAWEAWQARARYAPESHRQEPLQECVCPAGECHRGDKFFAQGCRCRKQFSPNCSQGGK